MSVHLALALALALGVAVPASAAPPKPPPVCDLLVDARGDVVSGQTGTVPPDDAAFDLVGGDVATSGSRVTVVWRMADMEATPLYGVTLLSFFFRVGDSGFVDVQASFDGPTPGYHVYAEKDVAGNRGFTQVDGANAQGTVDRGRREVRVTFDGSVLPSPVQPGLLLDDLSISSARLRGLAPQSIGFTGSAEDMDDAESDRTYKAGQRSCVS